MLITRSPNFKELDSLIEIIYASERTWYSFSPPTWQPRERASLTNILIKAFISSRLLVSDRDGQLTGLIIFRPEFEAVNPDPHHQDHSCHISTFFVRPEFFGRGDAKLLFAEALLETQGYKCRRLWVPIGAERASYFYLSQGFNPTGRTMNWDGLERRELRTSCAA